MWFIKNTEGEIIYLKPNEFMIVSRKEGCDIVLRNDASISKLHASITVKPKINFKNNEPSSTVIVQDSGSKYGTFVVNGKNQLRKLTAGDHILTVTDKIRFGLQNHIFTVHYVPFIVSTSTLNNSEKVLLQNIVDTLDGVIIEKCEEYCTHLTVSNVTLTAQVVRALVFGTPIVSLEYWEAVKESVKKKEKIPDVENFIPLIHEGLINRDTVSLKTNAKRKVLFKNIIFVSFSTSQSPLKNIIKSAGGKLVLFKEGLLGIKELCSKNVVVLQLTNSETQPSQASVALYDSIQNDLQKKNRRLIPESEISLAVLYCSTKKYCNPKFDFKRLIGLRRQIENPLSSTILEPDTQDILPTTQRVKTAIINESFTLSEQIEEQEAGASRKGKLVFEEKPNVNNIKDSGQRAVGNRRILDKLNFGSEESSREDALIIDETRSSIDSDNIDTNIKRYDLSNELNDTVNKVIAPTARSAGGQFNLQSKLQISKVSKKNNVSNETRSKNSSKYTEDNLFSNPSTSKDTAWTKFYKPTNNVSDNEETTSRKRIRNISDEESMEQNSQRRIIPNRKRDATTGKNLSSSKRNSAEEEHMFSFENEDSVRIQKKVKRNDEDNFFELLEEPNAESSQQDENMFGKKLDEIHKYQRKRRLASLSSDDFSIEEEMSEIKVEKSDTDDIDIDDDFKIPLIQCKKESDDSINETCKSTVLSLLRTDIDLTLNISAENFKTFVKAYTTIPIQRIKLKDMYEWKCKDEPLQPAFCKEELSSSGEDDDFKFYSNIGTKKTRARN